MSNLRFGVLACAVGGLVGAFLPYLPLTGEMVSFYKLTGALGERAQFYLTIAGFVLALAMALIAITKPPMTRWQGIVSSVGFAWVIMKLRDQFPKLITDGAVGAKVMALLAIVGLVVAILCAVKLDARRPSSISAATS